MIIFSILSILVITVFLTISDIIDDNKKKKRRDEYYKIQNEPKRIHPRPNKEDLIKV
jgi:hypothetical protein